MLHVPWELCFILVVFYFRFILDMPRLSKDQRVWVCLEHARIQNAAEVRTRWPGRWGNIPAPSKRTISTTHWKFLQEATCHDLNKGRSGHPRTARTPENIELVRESLTQHGNRSSRRNGLELSSRSFHRIAKPDIIPSIRYDYAAEVKRR